MKTIAEKVLFGPLKKEDIIRVTDSCRYSENLGQVIQDLKGLEVLRLLYESDYQGEVDISVLLEDNRVFSYHYYYGSCSGCDSWECESLDDKQIEERMIKEATFFDNIEQYNEWHEKIKQKIYQEDGR